MAVDTTVPAWIKESIKEWRDRLMLWGWRLHLGMALTVNDDPNTLGLCQQLPNINTAHLTFRLDADPEDEEWQRAIIHELLHVSHARIDQIVQEQFLPAIPETAREMANTAYVNAIEAYTEQMAEILHRLRSEIPSEAEAEKTEAASSPEEAPISND